MSYNALFIYVHISTRAMEFIYVFLETFVSGEQDLAVCARKAYGDTLKRYHGWIVQGIFSVSDVLEMIAYSYLYLGICTPLP